MSDSLAEDVLKRHTPHILARDECQECEAIQPRSRQCDAYRLAVMVRDIEALAEESSRMRGTDAVALAVRYAADRILAITREGK